ncbi:TonB-dependent receptor [Elongatibacter sediminis]|uniref:TonB-dependent receptor n=1 Tax=Elongatibacter sediminis TaxID=3119006 RepID=A0AAW9RC69_9GAMM
MKRNPLSAAVLCGLAASVAAYPAAAQQRVLEEVTVTATKREASLQDVPITVQALTGETLDELNVGNFDDYVRFLPNVNAGGRGPGQNEVYIRGMSIDAITVMLSGAQGSTPNVAMYLDEQPITAPGRNLDVYVADMERIEVLPGPQGTLYGISSQAGTIRMITNKPDVTEFDAGFKASMADTKSGDMSYTTEAFLNFPVIENTFAVRAVVYNASYGGYIDNVAGQYQLDPAVNTTLPADADYSQAVADNAVLVEDNFNDATYRGARISAKYWFNDEWSGQLTYMNQKLETDGVFDYDPAVGDLQVERYFEDSLEDEFDQIAWTLEGRMGALEVLYTGAYLDRNVEQSVDYTGYNNVGGFIAYYTCTYTNPDYIVNYGIDPNVITDVRTCLDPTKGFKGQQDITRNTHEFRLFSPQDKSVRVTAGVFYDDFELETQDDYFYLPPGNSEALGFAQNAPISTARNINPNVRPVGVGFFNDITRTEEQWAVFGEVTWDISEQWTAALGWRWYDMDLDFYGSSNFTNGIFQGSVDSDRGRDYDSTFGHSTEPLNIDGSVPKLTVTWRPTDNLMVYGTYSEGFRSGGWNRGGGAPSFNPSFPTVPVTYDTDDVINYELGWKATLAGGAVQWNGAVYYVEWEDMQTSRFDPINVSILTFIDNAADSEIRGIETDFVWAATDNLTLHGALAYIDTELTATQSTVIELAPVGSELALTPEFAGTLRARYDWFLDSMQVYAQGAVQYAGDSWSSIVAADRRKQDSYTTVDLSVGTWIDNWNVELYVRNLTDERADLFFNVQDDIPRITTNRPRTYGIRFSYDY